MCMPLFERAGGCVVCGERAAYARALARAFMACVCVGVAAAAAQQETDRWYDLTLRAGDPAAGRLRLRTALAADGRPRIALGSGCTAVAAVDGRYLRVLLDGSGGEELGEFRAHGDVTAWAVSPADPRVMAIGDSDGRVALVRFEGSAHCHRLGAPSRFGDARQAA
jgi:hypothetical protein